MKEQYKLSKKLMSLWVGGLILKRDDAWDYLIQMWDFFQVEERKEGKNMKLQLLARLNDI